MTFTEQEMTRIVTDSFKGLPSLEYIILRDYVEHADGYRYSKLTLSPNSTDDLLQEDLIIDYDVGMPWWSVYNV